MELDVHCSDQFQNPNPSSELIWSVLSLDSVLSGMHCPKAHAKRVHTQHVSTLILTATLFTNIRRYAKIQEYVSFIRVSLRVETADKEETKTSGEHSCQVFQLVTQIWEGKQVSREAFEWKVEICEMVHQHAPVRVVH